MKRTHLTILAAVLFAALASTATADTVYRIALKGRPAVVAKDKPVERGTLLMFHRFPDGAMTSVPREDVLSVTAEETAPAPRPATAAAPAPKPATSSTAAPESKPAPASARTASASAPAPAPAPVQGPEPAAAPVPAAAPSPAPAVSSIAFASGASPRPGESWVPPELRADRISLKDAIRMTIESAPSIRQARQNVAQRYGLFQEATGQFDSVVAFAPSYSRANGFLLRPALIPERQRRFALQTLGDVLASVSNDIETSLAQGRVQSWKYFGPCSGSTFTINGLTVCLDVSGTNIQPDVITNSLGRQQFDSILGVLAANDPNATERAQFQQIQKHYNDFYANLLQQFDVASRDVSDRSFAALANLGLLPRNELVDTLTLDLRYDIPLRNGFVFSPLAFTQGLSNNFEAKAPLAAFGGRGIPTSYTAVFGFSLDAPILKGAGVTATTAAERAAKSNADASVHLLAQTASESVLNTVLAYWNLAGAEERLTLLQRSAASQARITDLSEALVAGDEIPRSEMDLVRARRADADSQVAQAREALVGARVALARTIGLEVSDLSTAPLAADRLPDPPSPDRIDVPLDKLVRDAVARRADVQGLREQQEAAEALARAARINLLPALGLTFETDYRSRYETTVTDSKGNVSDASRDVFYGKGYQKAFGGHYTGPSFQLTLKLTLPIQNNVARGLLVQAESALSTSAIAARNLQRTVESRAVQTLRSAQESAREAERHRASSGYYEQTIHNSFEQYRGGEISVLDAILTERDLTTELLNAVSARQNFASDLTQLRFESGTLLPYTRSRDDVVFGEVDPSVFGLPASR